MNKTASLLAVLGAMVFGSSLRAQDGSPAAEQPGATPEADAPAGEAGPAAPEAVVEPIVPAFRVTYDPQAGSEPVSGRLVVWLIKDDAPLGKALLPQAGPFWDSPQPMGAVDVKDFKPGDSVLVDSSALWYPAPLNKLPEGLYRMGASLDFKREHSDWKEEHGNFRSSAWLIALPGEDGIIEDPDLRARISYPFDVPLHIRTAPVRTFKVKSPESGSGQMVDGLEIRSEILSAFHGRDVMLRAGVMKPTAIKNASYPVVYEVPGFGGDAFDALKRTTFRIKNPGMNRDLWRSSYRVILDAEGPNGHNLFADSANNGPVGEALVKELIPALEAKYPFIAEPAARVITGHSSGGWSAIWLALKYPDVFGAAWATGPDPVDFRALQLSNIYDDSSVYTDASGALVPSYRGSTGNVMMARDENLMEEVMGSGGTSGQQWDSWQAVFGPRGENGLPVPLFDWQTGAIDRAVAEHWKNYDIGAMFRAEPEKYGPLFRDRIRIAVGTMDNFFLHRAVELLRADLEKAGYLGSGGVDSGEVRVVEGLDHGSIRDVNQQMKEAAEILAFWEKHGVLPRETGGAAEPATEEGTATTPE